MSHTITIAIDGHSSTGKSTAAKQLAQRLKYIYVDTGAMYRAVSYYALRENIYRDNQLHSQELIDSLDKIKVSFQRNEETDRADVYLNGENIEKQIRTLEVSSIVSLVAAVSEVRAKLVAQQQEMGKEKGVVMDGRDIGTVVFPNAELKVFMTAAPEVRAQRRYEELLERGDEVIYEEVLKNVIERDHIDSTREDSPLIQTEDAMLLDTSEMSREQQFEQLVCWAQDVMNC